MSESIRVAPSEPEPPVDEAQGSSRVRTLVERASGVSLLLATLVFLANMVGAWWIMQDSGKVIARALVGEEATAVSEALAAAPDTSANGQVLLNRILDTELMLRTAQNQHTIIVVAMSAAFALVAVGFALFVMGAEGAFKLQGAVGDHGNMVIKSTAPGLLCFVLAALVICFALRTKMELRTSEFFIPDQAAVGEVPNDPAAEERAPEGPDVP